MAQPPHPTISIDCRVITDRWPWEAHRLSTVSAACLVLPPLLLAAERVANIFHASLSSFAPDTGLLLLFWILGTPWFALQSVRIDTMGAARPGRIEVDEEGVRVVRADDVRTVPAADVVAGIALTTVSGPAVDLHLRDGRVIRAAVGNERDAQMLLGRLGLGRDRRRVSVLLGSEGQRIAAGVLAFIAATFAVVFGLFPLTGRHVTDATALLGALVVVAATLLARWLAAPAQVVIGSEGVMVRRAGRSKFVFLADIERASIDRRNVVLDLHGPHASARRRGADRIVIRGHDAALATGIIDRIREATAAMRPDAVVSPEMLDPDGRTFSEWREALGGLLRADAGYRSAALRPDDLLTVVEDVSAPARRRIGAALALRGSDHTEACTRVRIAAGACADDLVRAALEATAAEEFDEAPIRRVIEVPER